MDVEPVDLSTHGEPVLGDTDLIFSNASYHAGGMESMRAWLDELSNRDVEEPAGRSGETTRSRLKEAGAVRGA